MLAAFGIGSMGQVNKIVANVVSAFDIKALSDVTLYANEGGTITLYHLIIGVVVMALTAAITLGGLKRIASVAEKIVPVMVVLFVVGSLAIITVNYNAILPAFKAIFVNAFSPEAFVGGGFGEKFVAIAMFLFAFTTVLGWSHYGSKAWEYLFGAKTVIIFKIIHVCTVTFGAILTSSLAWDLSDTFNGLMMIPNLIGVVVLFPLVMKITKNYVNRKIKKMDDKPILSYDPELRAQHEATLSEED